MTLMEAPTVMVIPQLLIIEINISRSKVAESGSIRSSVEIVSYFVVDVIGGRTFFVVVSISAVVVVVTTRIVEVFSVVVADVVKRSAYRS